MKKKVNSFLIFMTSALLFACRYQGSNEKLLRQADNIKRIDASIPNNRLKFDQFFKPEKLIFLKNDSTEGLLQAINKVFFFKNKWLVVDRRTPHVSFFDINGKFLKKIISPGKGPGEFTGINDVLIDTCANSILIFSTNDRKLAWFDSDGLYLKERRVTFTAQAMNWLSYPYLIFTTNYGYTGEDGAAYSCIVADTSGKQTGQYLKHPPCEVSFAFSGINIASDTDGPLMAEALEDTVFQVEFSAEEKTLKRKPFVCFSFGKRTLPAVNSRCNFFVEHRSSISSNYDYLLNHAFAAPPYFFFSFSKNRQTRWGVLNNKTDSVFLNNTDYDEDYRSYLEMIPHGVMGTDRIIVPVSHVQLFNLHQYHPGAYNKFIKDYPFETVEIQKILSKGSEAESNPFLAVFTIKQ